MNEMVPMEFTRDTIFVLFHSVLVRDKFILNRQNVHFTQILNELWKEISDKHKIEYLFHQKIRNRLDYWSVSYEDDLIRLEIPKNLEQ